MALAAGSDAHLPPRFVWIRSGDCSNVVWAFEAAGAALRPFYVVGTVL